MTTDADRIRAAVLTCPTVADVIATPRHIAEIPGADAATDGGRPADDTVDVHVIVSYGQPLAEIGTEIGAALSDLLAGRVLHVYIDDILAPGESLPATPADPPDPADPAVPTTRRTTP